MSLTALPRWRPTYRFPDKTRLSLLFLFGVQTDGRVSTYYSGLRQNKLDAVLRAGGEQLFYFTVWDFNRWRQRHGGRRHAALLEISFPSGRGQQHEHPHLLGFDFKRVHDIPWQEDHRSGCSLDRLAADRSGHRALKNVEGFVFSVVDVRRRHIAFFAVHLDQREPPLSLFTGCEERQQMAAVPDRLFKDCRPRPNAVPCSVPTVAPNGVAMIGFLGFDASYFLTLPRSN